MEPTQSINEQEQTANDAENNSSATAPEREHLVRITDISKIYNTDGRNLLPARNGCIPYDG